METKAERSIRRHDYDFFGWVTDPLRRRDIEELSVEPLDHRGEPRWKGYNDIDVEKITELTEHQLFLLPQHTLGFALDTKQWSTSICSWYLFSLTSCRNT